MKDNFINPPYSRPRGWMWLWIQLNKDWKLHGTGHETNKLRSRVSPLLDRIEVFYAQGKTRESASEAVKEGLDHHCGGEEMRRYKVGRWLIGSGWKAWLNKAG